MKPHVVLLLAFALALPFGSTAFAVEDATSADIEAKLADKDLAVVEVHREGCEFCLKMFPVVRKFEEANPSAPVYRVLVSDEGFKTKYKVSDIPAFLVFKQGKISHAFFGLMDNDQFYQSVYFAPVAVRDPELVLFGVRELMGDLIPSDLKLFKVKGGFYAVTDSAESVGFARVYLDGTVLDASGARVGAVSTSVPPGSCCSGGKKN